MSIFIAACGPGVADYSERIGKTGYTLSRTDSIHLFIYPSCIYTCESDSDAGIGAKVLSYRYNDRIIVAMRQIVRDYRCDENYLTMEVTSEIVFQYILLATGEVFGPWSQAEFLEIIESEPDLFEPITLASLLENRQRMSDTRPLTACTNAVKI